MSKFDTQVSRNVMGQEFEKQNLPDKAIPLYEANVSEGFEGSFPYRRLAIIYRNKGLIQEEIRVLEKAIKIYSKVVNGPRPDGQRKLQEFETRLLKMKKKNAT